MNQFEMIVLIVAIVMIASVFKARMGGGRRRNRVGEAPHESDENARLKAEVRSLHERIATSKGLGVAEEIEQLRDQRPVA